MKICTKEHNPSVLVPDGMSEHGVKPETFKGELYRVHPVTSRDVFGLQLLDHHEDKFAPANGGGVMITPRALAKLNA